MLYRGMRSNRSLSLALGSVALLAVSLTAAPAASTASVAVLRSAAWSAGDNVREGAGEFEVLLCAAQLKQTACPAGIVGTGDRHGMFLNGAERALRRLALGGLPVAKVPRGDGDFAADPEGIFIDASGLSEAQARNVLTRCLERYGTPPRAANPARPTARELDAIREHLSPFRQAFALARAPLVAMQWAGQ